MIFVGKSFRSRFYYKRSVFALQRWRSWKLGIILEFEAWKWCASEYFGLEIYLNQILVHFQCFCDIFALYLSWNFFGQGRKWQVGEMTASFCWVRLGSSTWNVLWLWNTNKERLQKQVHKATWKLTDNLIKEQRQKERIRMHTVILSNDLNSRRTNTDTGFANTWFTRTLYRVIILTIKSPLGGEQTKTL